MKAAKTRLCVNGWCNFTAILTVFKRLVDMETAEYQNRFRSKKFLKSRHYSIHVGSPGSHSWADSVSMHLAKFVTNPSSHQTPAVCS